MGLNHFTLVQELHLAQFEFVQRNWASRSRENELDNQLREMLNECRDLLNTSKNLLKHAKEGSTRYCYMTARFMKATNDFENWIADFQINI